MSDEPLLPHRITQLGKAMQPLLLKLKARIDKPVAKTSTTPDIAAFVSRHLDGLQDCANRLEIRIDGLMRDVVADETASDADVYLAVGRFEALLDDLLDAYHAIRTLFAVSADAEARDLLADVYRHTLVEIRDWLDELVDVIADPMAAVKKRGLPTRGYVELPLNLTLTAAPALAALVRWAQRESVSLALSGPSPNYPVAKNSGLGFWGTVGALALGWGIGETLFGDHDCRHD